jgi:uncharacterized membrane protein
LLSHLEPNLARPQTLSLKGDPTLKNTKTILFAASLILNLILIFGLSAIGYTQNNNAPQSNTPSANEGDSNTPAISEENNSPPKTNNPPSAPTVTVRNQYLTSYEFLITLMVSVIALLALLMEFTLLKRIPNLKAEETLRVFAVTLILLGTLFFITAGFDSNQVAPAMGLFGTVAGYLLGKSTSRNEDKDDATQ